MTDEELYLRDKRRAAHDWSDEPEETVGHCDTCGASLTEDTLRSDGFSHYTLCPTCWPAYVRASLNEAREMEATEEITYYSWELAKLKGVAP